MLAKMHLTETHERVLIILISLHSIIVGIMLMFFAEWAVSLAGWAGADPVFSSGRPAPSTSSSRRAIWSSTSAGGRFRCS